MAAKSASADEEDIAAYSKESLQSIQQKRDKVFPPGNQQNEDDSKESSALNLKLSASTLSNTKTQLFSPSTPYFETVESAYADINESEDEFLDDDEVDDDDYEYHTDEDWNSDDDDEAQQPKVTKIIGFTRPIAKSVTEQYSKPNEQKEEKQSTHLNVGAHSMKPFHHFKIRSVTIYGNLGLDVNEHEDINQVRKKHAQRKNQNLQFRKEQEEKEKAKQEESKSKEDNECEIKRSYIKQEMIETEKSYLKGLQTLLNEFIKPIFEQKMIGKKYEKEVTSIIPTIIQFHQIFLEDLHTEFEKKEEGNMASVFIKSAAFLKLYIDYITHYQRILDIFAKHNKAKKLKKYLKQKRKERKPLTNHLILPIQRIPRYMLLLEDLKKKTPDTHKNYGDLSEALEIITNVANSINEQKRTIENMSQCLQVMENLRELNRNIVEPHRKYLGQFTFRKKDNQRLREFFVFSDLIIICNLKMKVKMVLDMRTTELKQQSSSNVMEKRTVEETMVIGYKKQAADHIDPSTMYQFILFTAKGKPVEYETDKDKVDDVIQLKELIIKSRLHVWDGDLSRLTNDGRSEIRDALKKSGVSQADQYKHQLEELEKLREEKNKSTLNEFKTAGNVKGKKNKVLGMLGQ
mmetsp:Transcript_37697/g.60374  ORF Transcript_37697/g.60374 Transcript_37697/m.60374 type:complete len:631 (+) Transcript_37697:47-1939(+)|eukprot:CAMPEP_0197025600 /NCGR_PEP_ID=MMETSP1384-20130603/5867_1 /TAXON_ID=29189 /ORGANISM="Ammonia sp." /LENGTH=630 /DNA_ID=CAMNT_0042454143 /DNA_START=23 /DNA_END=1915 /DNA_ORIENTATION=+